MQRLIATAKPSLIFKFNDKEKHYINIIKSININDLKISDYNKYYLKVHQDKIEYSVYFAKEIFYYAGQFQSVLEIGGGIGIMTLYAYFMDIKHITYNDISTTNCNDFKTLLAYLNINTINIIEGDIINIESEINEPNIIISRDVIEHIYNLNLFFKNLYLKFPKAIHIHNTSATFHNYIKNKKLNKIQIHDEYDNNPFKKKAEDEIGSFLETRYHIILNAYPELDKEKLLKYAKESRGLIKDDIIQYVELRQYKNHKIRALPFNNNTCNPNTGSFTEQLLSWEMYESLAQKDVTFYNSYYNIFNGQFSTKLIKKALNWLIYILGKNGRIISPAFVIKTNT